MFARRLLALSGALLLCMTGLRASPLEADPHELYEQARTHLRNGELESADASLHRLRDLLSHGSQWDPDGVFANELLPPLQKKLARLEAVTRQLDAFSARALEDLNPPQISDEASNLRPYAEWASSVIQRLRTERDHIITSGLADPEEQAAVTRTASYARTEQVLETDVMRSMAESSEAAAPDPRAGDPRIDPMAVRLGQLKRDMMRLMIERDQLEQQAKQASVGDKAYLRALAVLVTEGRLPAPRTGNLQPKTVADLFGQYLDHELEQARLRTAQTSPERDDRRQALVRYRRYNSVLTRAGLGKDQSRRLQALSQAVEACPVKTGLLVTSSAARWLYVLLTSALALIAGFSTWLAMARGRKLPAARKPDAPDEPVIDATFPRRSVDGNAA